MLLYSIDVRRKDDDTDSDRGRQRGLKSPFGRRGAICAHYGWTWDYLHNGIAWSIVQRMLADAPDYDYKSKDEEVDHVRLSKKNAHGIANYINNLM